MPTVAEMLSGQPAPQADPSQPPPGFVTPAADPAPPPGFQVQAATPRPTLVQDMVGAIVNPIKALGADAQRYYQAASTPTLPKSPLELIPGFSPQEKAAGSMIGDVAGILGAPANAVIVQPTAHVLDKLPAPIDVKTGQPMTPEQQHATNVDAISSALMGLGPSGMKAGAGVEAMTAKYAGKVAQVVAEVPKEVVLDPQGKITPEGREIVAQKVGHDLHADDLAAGYQAAEEVKAKQAAETPAPEAAPPEAAPPPAEPGAPVEPAPAPEVAPEPAAPPAAPVEEAPPPSSPLGDPAATPADRVARAQDLGVDLTAGQAERSFDKQANEQALAAQDQSPEGQIVRAHFDNQAQQIARATEAFQSALGDPSLTKTDRGEIVQSAAQQLRQQGQKGVSALYQQARDLAEQASGMGGNAHALIQLDAAPLRAAIRDLLIDETVPETTRKGLAQWGAKFGLVGEEPKFVPDTGMGAVKVRTADGDLVSGPSFPGPVEPLDLTNAERFRAKINDLFDAKANRNPQESLKPILDKLVTDAAERAATEGVGPIGEAFTKARDAAKENFAKFQGGDVVQKISQWRKGGAAPTPEEVINAAFKGGPEGVTNLRRIKAVFMSGGEAGKNGWRALQAQAVADIFREALSTDNTISGLKLNSAIKRFGPKKLELLLGEEQFGSLMKLRRVIADATIPLPRTTNASGSGWAVTRFLSKIGVDLLKPAAKSVFVVRPLVEEAEAWQAKRQTAATVEGVTSYKPEPKAAEKADGAGFVRRFLEAAPKMLPAALAAGGASQQIQGAE